MITEKYWKKRLWFLHYVNKKMYDRTEDNTTLVVSRENILEESFNQFMTTQELDLRKAMHIYFVDEVAQDVGGVYREWYSALFETIFSKSNNFFYQVSSKYSQNTYFIPVEKSSKDNQLPYYEFIGKVIAKALFDKITLKMNLNPVMLKLLLNHKLVLDDLKYLDESVSIFNFSTIIL
jgi:hypothetical protein